MKTENKQGWKVTIYEKESVTYSFKFANDKSIKGVISTIRTIDKVESQSQVDYIKEYYEDEGYEVIIEPIEWEE